MPEYWTDYPKMEWWKLDPSRWMRSRKYRELEFHLQGAFVNICMELMQEKSPGVVSYYDEQLADWAFKNSRISAGNSASDLWKTWRVPLMAAFVVYEDGTIHQQTIKELYEERCRADYEYYVKGKLGWFLKSSATGKRGRQKLMASDVPLEHRPLPYRSPYSRWEKMGFSAGDLWVKNRAIEGGLFVQKNEQNKGGYQEGAYKPPYTIREDKMRSEISFQTTHPASAGGDAVAETSPPADEPIGTILRRAHAKANAPITVENSR